MNGDETPVIGRWSFSWPPSLNNCYPDRRGGGRRVKSTEYQRWCIAAAHVMRLQPLPVVPERESLALLLRSHRPTGRSAGDVDNRVKPVQDLIATVLGFNDYRIDAVFAFRDAPLPSGRVDATLLRAEPLLSKAREWM